jgi:hypothetical protein
MAIDIANNGSIEMDTIKGALKNSGATEINSKSFE